MFMFSHSRTWVLNLRICLGKLNVPHLVPGELLPDPAPVLAELLHAGVADVAPGPAVELSQHAVEWIPGGYDTFR